jgi:glycosyltransferase involved in cell wall biosynthesis
LPGRSRWAQLIVRGADALWFVSNAQRDRFLELLPNRAALPRTLVSPMGIDLPALAPLDAYARAEFRRRHQLQGFCVLVLGRLVAIKGVDVAVRAAAMGGMTLLVAGDGPARAELVQLARELSVPVRWLGVVVGEDKQRWFEAVDAFVLPSRRLPDGRSEGLPCALLEALAHGLPVVASRLDGITELFEDDGYAHALVPPDDPAALHAALLALGERHAHDNRDDRDNNRDNLTRQQYGRDGRDGSRDVGRFGWSQVGARIAELLEHAETARRTDTAQGIGRSLR